MIFLDFKQNIIILQISWFAIHIHMLFILSNIGYLSLLCLCHTEVVKAGSWLTSSEIGEKVAGCQKVVKPVRRQ